MSENVNRIFLDYDKLIEQMAPIELVEKVISESIISNTVDFQCSNKSREFLILNVQNSVRWALIKKGLINECIE